MNKDTNRWAVEVGNENLSEAIQTIAFSFGYNWGWPHETKLVKNITAKYLVFNPEDKSILYGTTRGVVEPSVCQIVTTFDDVMKLFKNPPVNELKFSDSITVNNKGDVTISVAGQVIISPKFDDLVKERAKFIGKEVKRKLPVVDFTYTSQSSGRKERHVMVTEMDEFYISGLDMDDGDTFKKFLVGKVIGKVEMTGFVEV